MPARIVSRPQPSHVSLGKVSSDYDPDLDLQRHQRHHALLAARLLCDGARSTFLSTPRRSTSAFPDAGLRRDCRCSLVSHSRHYRHLRATSDLRHLRWLDFLRARRGEHFHLSECMPEAGRPYRVPGYPATSLLFIAAAAALVANTIITQPTRAGIGLGIVLLGAPAYLIWRPKIESGEDNLLNRESE